MARADTPFAGIQLAQQQSGTTDQPSGQQILPRASRRPSGLPHSPALPQQAQPGESAVSQSQTSEPSSAPTGRSLPQQRIPSTVSVAGQVSLNFDDADVYSIIQTIFGDVLRVNYVVDPRVKGRVTFRSVAPVPNESVLPIMEVIFRLNGIGIIEENGLYRIIPISEISKEPSPVRHGKDPASVTITGKSILQVIPIQYVQSTEVIRLIQPFVSANAVIVDVPKGKLIYHLSTTNPDKAKDVLGGTVCLMGNVPNIQLLSGTPDDVRATCKKLIDKMGKGGGFIMDTALMLDEAKPENLKSMLDFTKDYGIYR